MRTVAPLFSLALAACAIAPVQQNVTGLPIVRIVNHIRCETRVAIQRKALDELRKYAYDKPGHPRSALADQLEASVGNAWRPGEYLPTLDKTERDFYNRYIQTGIAYTYSFDITEDDKAALNADPVRLVTNGMLGIGLNSSGDFSRENQRTFVVSETFQKLLERPIPGCAEEPQRPENFAYPIAGTVGMEELISNFIDLNENEALQAITASSGSSSKSASAAPASDPYEAMASAATAAKPMAAKGSSTNTPAVGSGVFSDTLSFTTTLMGGVTPSLQINPLGRQWGLATGTNFAATVTRTDHHNLQVGLSLATPGEAATQTIATPPYRPAVLVTSAKLAPSALQKHRNEVTPAEQRALDAMTQQRIDNFLTRFGTFGVRP